MQISSSEFKNNQEIPDAFTCNGKNINPPLEFTDIPEATKSLVLIFEDADSTPITWIHWLVFNIPTTTLIIEEGEVPKGGTQGLCNNKTFGYEGPCPKYFKGIHHYKFTLLALDKMLEIPKKSDNSAVMKTARYHIIAKAELIGVKNGKIE